MNTIKRLTSTDECIYVDRNRCRENLCPGQNPPICITCAVEEKIIIECANVSCTSLALHNTFYHDCGIGDPKPICRECSNRLMMCEDCEFRL